MAHDTKRAGDALPRRRRSRKPAVISMFCVLTGLAVGNLLYLSKSDVIKTFNLKKTHHEPVVREADTHHGPVEGEAETDAMIDSNIETITSRADDRFTHRPLGRAADTHHGPVEGEADTHHGPVEGEADTQHGPVEGEADTHHGPVEGEADTQHGPAEGEADTQHGPAEGEADTQHGPAEGEADTQHGPAEGEADTQHGPAEGEADTQHGPAEGEADTQHGPAEGEADTQHGPAEGEADTQHGPAEGEADTQHGPAEGEADTQHGPAEGEADTQHGPAEGEADTQHGPAEGEADTQHGPAEGEADTHHGPAEGEADTQHGPAEGEADTQHGPAEGEADTHHGPAEGEAETDAMIDSSIETITSRADNRFTHGPEVLCEDLVNRANGTEEGREPWRSSGTSLLWSHSGCESEAVDALGNHLSRWYEARAIASAAGVTIDMLDCISPVTDSIPQHWKPSETVLENPSSFSWKEACRHSFTELLNPHESGIGLVHMVGAIRSDLRNMTQTILSKTAGLEQDLDEAVIHLRIGDIGRGVNPLYGLVPFHVYTDLIPRTAQTIGVITAPFRQERNHFHPNDPELNEAVVVAARDHIQGKFPDARVSIRNGNETMAVTYARIVAANWSFCGSSTFCLFPALATAGESYILQSPLYGGNEGWLNKVAESFKNVHYKEGKIIFTTEYHEWNLTDIVEALQRDAGN
ncbi:hypothetical protein MHU86_9129 [Fragilaria crotonensis]|nr:hypothetical protein MHU86_9129 [Fragilaria crotonensis]